MTQMVVDPGWVEQLRDAVGAVEMVSPDGEELGTFIPKQPTLAEIMAGCPYTEDELNRRAEAAIRSGRALSEILHDLEAKWPSR